MKAVLKIFTVKIIKRLFIFFLRYGIISRLFEVCPCVLKIIFCVQ